MYNELKRNNVEMSQPTYRAVMDAYRQKRDLVSVVQVWTLLSGKHLPDPKSISIIFQSASEMGQKSTAVAIHGIIRPEWIINRIGYCHLLDLTCKWLPELTFHVMIDLVNSGNTLDHADYCRMRDLCKPELFQPIYSFVEEHFPEIMEEVDDE